jgi:hypothetical protein
MAKKKLYPQTPEEVLTQSKIDWQEQKSEINDDLAWMDYLAQGLQIVGNSLISSGGQPIENNTQKKIESPETKATSLTSKSFQGSGMGQELQVENQTDYSWNTPFMSTGGEIKINPKNKGKFTRTAKQHNMSVQAFAEHVLANPDKYSSLMIKRANFAKNATKFKHAVGGNIDVNKLSVEGEPLPEFIINDFTNKAKMALGGLVKIAKQVKASGGSINSIYDTYKDKNILSTPQIDLMEQQINNTLGQTPKAQSTPKLYKNPMAFDFSLQTGTTSAKKPVDLYSLFENKDKANEWFLANQKKFDAGLGVDLPSFADGGQIKNVPVEVEGGELYETPYGETSEVEGALHEQGGVNMTLPEGTEVYSNRTGINGETFAERKRKRDAKKSTLENYLEDNPYDIALANSLQRLEEVNAFDEGAQQVAQQSLEENGIQLGQPTEMGCGGKVKRMADGSTVEKYFPGIFDVLKQKEVEEDVSSNPLGELGFDMEEIPSDSPYSQKTENLPFGMTEIVSPNAKYKLADSNTDSNDNGNKLLQSLGFAGDMMNLYGSLSLGPKLENLATSQRGQDMPHENPYRGVMDMIDTDFNEAEGKLQNITKRQAREIQDSKQGLNRNLRNSARGVNTLISLLGASEGQAQDSIAKLSSAEEQALMQLLARKSGMKLSGKQLEGHGKMWATEADEADEAGFYSLMRDAMAIKSIGQKEAGSALNKKAENKFQKNFMTKISDMYMYDEKTGNMVLKPEFLKALEDSYNNKQTKK